MIGLVIIVLAVFAVLLRFLGNQQNSRPLRAASVYLLAVALVLTGLVIANILPGGKP